MRYKIPCSFFLVLLFSLPVNSWAQTYKQCFLTAARTYNVPYHTLLSISFTESSLSPHAHNKRNRNSTSDYGFMQINSLWRKVSGINGFQWAKIINNPCTNIKFGAWILSKNYKRLGNWPHAIGAYNAGFSKSAKARKRRLTYYKKVMRNTEEAKRYAFRLNKRVQSLSGIYVWSNETPASAKDTIVRAKKPTLDAQNDENFNDFYKKEVDLNTDYGVSTLRVPPQNLDVDEQIAEATYDEKEEEKLASLAQGAVRKAEEKLEQKPVQTLEQKQAQEEKADQAQVGVEKLAVQKTTGKEQVAKASSKPASQEASNVAQAKTLKPTNVKPLQASSKTVAQVATKQALKVEQVAQEQKAKQSDAVVSKQGASKQTAIKKEVVKQTDVQKQAAVKVQPVSPAVKAASSTVTQKNAKQAVAKTTQSNKGSVTVSKAKVDDADAKIATAKPPGYGKQSSEKFVPIDADEGLSIEEIEDLNAESSSDPSLDHDQKEKVIMGSELEEYDGDEVPDAIGPIFLDEDHQPILFETH